ncbi:hypothetical protein [Kineosporia sp. R_H_3]|uniref:phosphatase domain-containing protein n=1 Tax=Kineosporia sp. R_H_3 TaxID=1961848 RepID=UPI000B4A6C8D|nr:hypothetical protein [Kineosporia sp. R_H_3]
MTDGAAPEGDRLPDVAVLDLDGVLADTRHRLHHLAGGRARWAAFFAAATDDPVHAEGRAVVEEVLGRGLAVFYLSGRPERTAAATRAWLRRHDLPDAPLLLRADDDRRPATAVKISHLRRLARQARVVVLVDDDPAVVAAVRALRPPLAASVLHATWQPRDDATDRGQHGSGRM